MKFNQEWDFLITETHREKPNKTRSAKREVLFALQILLTKIERLTKVNRAYFLRQNYSRLKEVYLSQ